MPVPREERTSKVDRRWMKKFGMCMMKKGVILQHTSDHKGSVMNLPRFSGDFGRAFNSCGGGKPTAKGLRRTKSGKLTQRKRRA